LEPQVTETRNGEKEATARITYDAIQDIPEYLAISQAVEKTTTAHIGNFEAVVAIL